VAGDNYDEDEDFVIDGYVWKVMECYSKDTIVVVSLDPFKTDIEEVWYVSLERTEKGKEYNIWKVYDYSFFNWNFLREEKRAA
jgi:hypothetical protein